jgi:hypothetical protein
MTFGPAKTVWIQADRDFSKLVYHFVIYNQTKHVQEIYLQTKKKTLSKSMTRNALQLPFPDFFAPFFPVLAAVESGRGEGERD